MATLSVTAEMFSCRPSSFIEGLSGYDAYCLDTACALFLTYWKNEKRPDDYMPPEDEDATDWM